MATKTPGGKDTKRKVSDPEEEVLVLREKIRELEETLDAIRCGEVDAIIVGKDDSRQIYTLHGADLPYRALVENIQEGALTLSRAGIILYANSRFAGMVKMSPDNVAGTSILAYVCPEHRADMDEALRTILKKTCRMQIRIRQGTQSLPVLISMSPLSSDEDSRISVIVTDRRKDEERLQLLARMLDSVGDAVIAADTKNKIIYWNDAATKTYGWKPEEAIGRDLVDVVTPEMSRKQAQEIAARIARGGTWTGEYVVRHRDGHEFPVYANDAPVFDDDGRLMAIIGASHDITERKRVEDELKQKHNDLNAAYEEITSTQEELRRNVEELTKRGRQLQDALAEKEILLSEIHHRVKNNLTAFMSLLSLDGSYEETDAGRSLRKDLQNRARSMALIHETLYRTGKFSSVDMEVYLKTLVGQIAGTYAGKTEIHTPVHAEGIILDLARATSAGLIINELVTNSFKYAFPPGYDCRAVRGEPCTIGITLAPEDGTLVLTVRDNGCGLQPEIDPFATKTLGLKLVTFLARHQLRAEIAIQREKGTGFIFRLQKEDSA